MPLRTGELPKFVYRWRGALLALMAALRFGFFPLRASTEEPALILEPEYSAGYVISCRMEPSDLKWLPASARLDFSLEMISAGNPRYFPTWQQSVQFPIAESLSAGKVELGGYFNLRTTRDKDSVTLASSVQPDSVGKISGSSFSAIANSLGRVNGELVPLRVEVLFPSQNLESLSPFPANAIFTLPGDKGRSESGFKVDCTSSRSGQCRERDGSSCGMRIRAGVK